MILGLERELRSPPPLPSLFPLILIHKRNLHPFYNRRDDVYWPEGKRVAIEDRYRPDFPRYDHRFHDFDHRDRGQYQDHVVDRSAPHPLPAAGTGLCPFSYCLIYFESPGR